VSRLPLAIERKPRDGKRPLSKDRSQSKERDRHSRRREREDGRTDKVGLIRLEKSRNGSTKEIRGTQEEDENGMSCEDSDSKESTGSSGPDM